MVCIVFWSISLGIYALQYDAIDVFLPWRFYGSESLKQGIVPLWNPYQDGGYPFFADLQYSIWNPELFIVSLFSRYNATTIQFLYILYIVIGGLGFRYLLKQFKLDNQAAFYGGILFMLSGVIIGHGQSIVSVLGIIWLPWVIGSYLAVLTSSFTIKTTLAFILFTFLMLSSGYQAVSIMLAYVMLTFAIYRLIEILLSKNKNALKRYLNGHLISGAILGILMLGSILSLIDVFPYLSRLGGLNIEDTQRFITHPKAIISALFPLAALQIKFPHMDISFQNIFNGFLIFLLLIYGIKNFKKYSSPYLTILMIFGFIYGLASLGYFTPVQPFLAKYLPGFNLFYYPIFYRYFTWVFLLIVASFGLHYFIKSKSQKYFLYFLIFLLTFFLCAFFITIENLESVLFKPFENWGEVFRNFSFSEAVLLQSLLYFLLSSSFIVVYFIRKQKSNLILLFLVVELALISQLNIPVTVHGFTKTATINTYLTNNKEGFIIPNNSVKMSAYSNIGKEGVIWRNQGNFTNLPNLEGFTSFRLNNRKNISDNYPEIEKFIGSKPFSYLKSDKGNVIIQSFLPNHFVFKTTLKQIDTLVVQQANYPGWKVKINEIPNNILTVNGFEMGIPLQKGENTIDVQFHKPLIEFLFYLTHIGFIILLLFYFWLNYKDRRKSLAD